MKEAPPLPRASGCRAARLPVRARFGRCGLGVLLGGCVLLAACDEPRPRSYTEFMEDPIARDGTLLRCNADRAATANDLECANARRAAVTVALSEERGRREALEAESERLRTELRARIAQQQETERRAEALRAAFLQAAYDAQWADPDVAGDAVPLEVPPGLFDTLPLNPAQVLFGGPERAGADGEAAAAATAAAAAAADAPQSADATVPHAAPDPAAPESR